MHVHTAYEKKTLSFLRVVNISSSKIVSHVSFQLIALALNKSATMKGEFKDFKSKDSDIYHAKS